MNRSRADRATALERWADGVQADGLVVRDTAALQRLATMAEQQEALDSQLRAAVQDARRAGRSWSEIGLMLGVSKQAAQRKYSRAASAA